MVSLHKKGSPSYQGEKIITIYIIVTSVKKFSTFPADSDHEMFPGGFSGQGNELHLFTTTSNSVSMF